MSYTVAKRPSTSARRSVSIVWTSGDMELNSETLITANVATLGTLLGFYSRLVWRFARVELTQEFFQKALDAAHAKIRDLEQKRG